MSFAVRAAPPGRDGMVRGVQEDPAAGVADQVAQLSEPLLQGSPPPAYGVEPQPAIWNWEGYGPHEALPAYDQAQPPEGAAPGGPAPAEDWPAGPPPLEDAPPLQENGAPPPRYRQNNRVRAAQQPLRNREVGSVRGGMCILVGIAGIITGIVKLIIALSSGDSLIFPIGIIGVSVGLILIQVMIWAIQKLWDHYQERRMAGNGG